MLGPEERKEAIRNICCKRIEVLAEDNVRVVESYLESSDRIKVSLEVKPGVHIAPLEAELLSQKGGFSTVNLRTTEDNNVWEGTMTGCLEIYYRFKSAPDPELDRLMEREKQALGRKLGSWVFLSLLLFSLYYLIRCAWNSYDEALTLTRQWQAEATVPAPADLLYTTLAALMFTK